MCVCVLPVCKIFPQSDDKFQKNHTYCQADLQKTIANKLYLTLLLIITLYYLSYHKVRNAICSSPKQMSPSFLL